MLGTFPFELEYLNAMLLGVSLLDNELLSFLIKLPGFQVSVPLLSNLPHLRCQYQFRFHLRLQSNLEFVGLNCLINILCQKEKSVNSSVYFHPSPENCPYRIYEFSYCTPVTSSSLVKLSRTRRGHRSAVIF